MNPSARPFASEYQYSTQSPPPEVGNGASLRMPFDRGAPGSFSKSDVSSRLSSSATSPDSLFSAMSLSTSPDFDSSFSLDSFSDPDISSDESSYQVGAQDPSSAHLLELGRRRTLATSSSARAPRSRRVVRDDKYKTELCRSFVEMGSCRYGASCQFAHGSADLRVRHDLHPLYKTELCKAFFERGHCPYGTRCRFSHRKVALAESPKAQSGSSCSREYQQRMARLPIFEQISTSQTA